MENPYAKYAQPQAGPISSGFKAPPPVTPIDLAKESRDQAVFDITMQNEADKREEKAQKAADAAGQKATAATELRKLILQLEKVRLDVTDNGGFGETGTSGNIMRSIPVVSNAAKDFEGDLEPIKSSNAFAALAGLAEQGIKLTPISNMEIKLASDSVANLDPTKSQETFLGQLDLARGKYLTTLAALEGRDEAEIKREIDQEIAAALGVNKSNSIIDPNAPVTPRGPNYQAGPVESYVTDEDRARSETMQDAYNKGAGPAELNRLASELGMQPFPADTMRTLMEARKRGQQVSIAPFASGQQGMIEKAVSTVADSPVGAYGIGAANALTLGGLDEAAGFMGGESAGQRAQFAKDYSRENSPIASMVGEVAGIGALSAIPGVAPAMTSVRGGATLGGIYGGLDTNENRLLGAGLGAVTGGAVNKYAPQATNALAQAAAPTITRGKNVLNALAENLPGAQTRANARQEVTQNADVIAAGQAENIPVRQPDVRPSLRDQYGGAEASQYGGPKIQKAASEDAQAIANRIAEIGGGGTTKQGYSLGSATQDAIKAEKGALRDAKDAMYRRTELQAPGFKGDSAPITKAIDEKIAGIKAVAPEGNEAQINLLSQIKGNLSKTGISIESLQANRGIVRAKMKKDNLSFTPQEVELLDVLDTAAIELEKAMKASGNDAAHATLQRANAMNREYIEFKRDVVKTIVGTNNQPVQPETAAQRLLAMVSSNGSSDKFAKIYKALPSDEKAGFKALIAENLGKNARGDFSLALLAKGLDQKNINYKSLREVFTPDEFQSLMNLRRLADAKDKAMSGRNFSNTARAANNAPTGFGAFVRGALGFSVGDVAGATAAVAGPSIAERIGTKRTVDMLLNTDFSKWLANMPNTANPRAIDAYLQKLDRIKAPAVASNVVIFKDYLRQAATQSPGKLAASEQEGDAGPIPPQQ